MKQSQFRTVVTPNTNMRADAQRKPQNFRKYGADASYKGIQHPESTNLPIARSSVQSLLDSSKEDGNVNFNERRSTKAGTDSPRGVLSQGSSTDESPPSSVVSSPRSTRLVFVDTNTNKAMLARKHNGFNNSASTNRAMPANWNATRLPNQQPAQMRAKPAPHLYRHSAAPTENVKAAQPYTDWGLNDSRHCSSRPLSERSMPAHITNSGPSGRPRMADTPRSLQLHMQESVEERGCGSTRGASAAPNRAARKRQPPAVEGMYWPLPACALESIAAPPGFEISAPPGFNAHIALKSPAAAGRSRAKLQRQQRWQGVRVEAPAESTLLPGKASEVTSGVTAPKESMPERQLSVAKHSAPQLERQLSSHSLLSSASHSLLDKELGPLDVSRAAKLPEQELTSGQDKAHARAGSSPTAAEQLQDRCLPGTSAHIPPWPLASSADVQPAAENHVPTSIGEGSDQQLQPEAAPAATFVDGAVDSQERSTTLSATAAQPEEQDVGRRASGTEQETMWAWKWVQVSVGTAVTTAYRVAGAVAGVAAGVQSGRKVLLISSSLRPQP
ncbi:g7402 [Coccomyxa elongata]